MEASLQFLAAAGGLELQGPGKYALQRHISAGRLDCDLAGIAAGQCHIAAGPGDMNGFKILPYFHIAAARGHIQGLYLCGIIINILMTERPLKIYGIL